ncbi:hypothetical protein LVO79_07495 [Roseivivax marinus]|uniref:hypothetical protein n=1 Tax=Roseivivax marinus TaxID=1379903 RepID=UPI001F03409F|nr:hypothetical protein [Roseivivax marinus]UMA66276.1 hypothetical protein LVO79_07495 [Roseivivax marinus]
MSKAPRPYAAILSPRPVGPVPRTFLRGVADVLAQHDGGSAGVRISKTHQAVAGPRIMVRVTVERDPARGARVAFALAARPGQSLPGRARCTAILSDIVLRSLPLIEARRVEWLQPDVLLSPDEFLAAQSYISPKRARREISALPDADESIDQIERNMTSLLEGEPALFTTPAAKPTPALAETAPGPQQVSETRARAASWSLTAALAVVSMPVAIGLSAVHALRGSDVRLSAHVLALTGTGYVLWQAGVLSPILDLAR